MCALACCWSLFTVNSTGIAQLPTIKTTKTLNSATCTAVWMAMCMCVCVCGRARVRMRAVSVSVCGRCRFAFVTIYFELDYAYVCVCVWYAYCAQALLLFCCLQFFVIVSLDGNTWGPSRTHSVATWRICTGRKCSPTQPTTERSCQLLHRCCAASAVVVVSHQRHTVKASATTTGSERTRCSFSGAAS